MRTLVALTAGACAVALSMPGGGQGQVVQPDRGGQDAFVGVSGDQFVLRGKPFHFVGANLAVMHGPDNRAAAEDVLTGAAHDGIKVARVWALGEGAADAAPWVRDNFLFRAGENGWIDAATAQLDRVIAAAGRAGVRLIVTLSNSWSDYGGVPRYLRWAGRWSDHVYGVTDRFYSDPGTRAAFRAHVERLLQRTNALTGVRYRDDPTILAWELMNESAVSTAAGTKNRRAWIGEMARLIHARDPHHLVSPGVSGFRFERERRDWLQVCRLKEIDFCDAHLYPEELLRDRDAALLEVVIDDYVALARTGAHKPFVLGEFGIRGDDRTGAWRGKTRAEWTARILDRLRGDGAAGGLVWIYQGPRGSDRSHGITIDDAGKDPAADAIRAVIKVAAVALDTHEAVAATATLPASATIHRPDGAAARDVEVQSSLMPLHVEFTGRTPSVPLIRADDANAGVLFVAWNPVTYARADWESSGVYDGGVIEHAWGAEIGWFEYEYIVMSASVDIPAAPSAPRKIGSVSIRARVSSEYPGTLSPPDGASLFDVSLDGVRLGDAIAPRDDGLGRWVIVTVPATLVPREALSPGTHRLRFTVRDGPHAHGLSLYGWPGKNAPAERPVDNGAIELRIAPPRR